MRKNVLFCYSRLPSFTNAVRDYVDAFGACSAQRIHYYDMDSGPIEFELDKFDCIIFNYCFWARCLAVTSDFTRRVAAFRGLKIAIFQDEYDYFLWHRQTIIALGVQTIVTCVPGKIRRLRRLSPGTPWPSIGLPISSAYMLAPQVSFAEEGIAASGASGRARGGPLSRPLPDIGQGSTYLKYTLEYLIVCLLADQSGNQQILLNGGSIKLPLNV